MNLLRYTQRETPPDRWRWKCRHTGHRIESMAKASWFQEIEKFNRENGFEQPENWREIAEHELCMLLPPGFCEYRGGGAPERQMLNTRTTAANIVAGTRVFLEWREQGMPLVTPEVAEQRAKTCAACYAAVPITGCGGCVGLVNLVLDIVGKGTTTADDELKTKSCAWCGCSALANVWIPAEVSQKGVTDEMLQTEIPWCWKIREIRALRAHS